MDIVDRIDDYLVKEDIKILVDLAMFMEEGDYIDEASIVIQSKSALNKMGIDIEKESEGIIAKLKKPELREFFKHLFSAFAGNEISKQKIKEMAKNAVSKGDIINVLLKLDGLTLHLISGPIHVLEYLTGWKVAGVKKKVENVTVRIQKSINTLKNLSQTLTGKEKKQITNFTSNLIRLEKRMLEK